MANVRKRFKNVSDSLQVIYDESGNKREIVPGGTIILEENWGQKFARFLVVVEAPRKETKKEDDKKTDKK